MFGVRRRHHNRRRQLDRRGVRTSGARGLGVACAGSIPFDRDGDGDGVGAGAADQHAGRPARGAPADASESSRPDGFAAPAHAPRGRAGRATGDVSAETDEGDSRGELSSAIGGRSPTAGVCAATDNATSSAGPSDSGYAVGTGTAKWRHATVWRDVTAADRATGTAT
jgi:hypothetical protein